MKTPETKFIHFPTAIYNFTKKVIKREKHSTPSHLKAIPSRNSMDFSSQSKLNKNNSELNLSSKKYD